MDSNEKIEGFPGTQMRLETRKKSPKPTIKPETFKLPLYNGNVSSRENEISNSFRKFKKLEPIARQSDYLKSDDNLSIRSKLIKFQNMDKRLMRVNGNFSVQDLVSYVPNENEDINQEQLEQTYQLNKILNTSRSSNTSLKQPEISRAKLKSKTPIYYSPDENLRNIKTPGYLAGGRWSPIKIRSGKNLKLHERFKIHSEYKSIFNRLDDDKDGHLNFEVLKNEYCKNMDHSQISFFYQIYDVLSEATYFGLQEFSTFYQLAQEFRKLDYKNTGFYWDFFISSDFEDYRKEIKDFINLIDHLDLNHEFSVEDVIKLRIKNLDNLIFNSQQTKMKMEVNKINQMLDQKIQCSQSDDNSHEIKLVYYVLYIPLFIYLESFFKNKQIFQRKNQFDFVR